MYIDLLLKRNGSGPCNYCTCIHYHFSNCSKVHGCLVIVISQLYNHGQIVDKFLGILTVHFSLVKNSKIVIFDWKLWKYKNLTSPILWITLVTAVKHSSRGGLPRISLHEIAIFDRSVMQMMQEKLFHVAGLFLLKAKPCYNLHRNKKETTSLSSYWWCFLIVQNQLHTLQDNVQRYA